MQRDIDYRAAHQSIPTDEVDGDGPALWVTIILPSLASTALVDTIDRGSWIGFGFWALQIIVQSMLIGLVAGDRDFAHLRGRRGALRGAEVCRSDSDKDQAPNQIREAAPLARPASRPADKVPGPLINSMLNVILIPELHQNHLQQWFATRHRY